jgi:hypothetical protein
VEIDEPGATVKVLDGQDKVSIERADVPKGELTVSVDPGKHRLRVEKNGFAVFAREFSIASGGRETIRARLEPLVEKAKQNGADEEAIKRADEEAKIKKNLVVLHPAPPTVVGKGPDQRIGFPKAVQVVFDSGSPQFLVPAKTVASGTLNISRLFFCREDLVVIEGSGNVYGPRKVDLWTPVRGGAYAQAAARGEAGNEEFVQLGPTRPLPDGVYCLHTGELANSKSPPSFCCPFIVRGYGIPQIEKAVANVRGGSATLSLVVRNTGLGELNDCFVVATVQKKQGSRSEFKERRHIKIPPIPAGGQRKIESVWETTDWKPGVYYFYGHVNYDELWDANTLAEFDSSTFKIVAGDDAKAKAASPND